MRTIADTRTPVRIQAKSRAHLPAFRLTVRKTGSTNALTAGISTPLAILGLEVNSIAENMASKAVGLVLMILIIVVIAAALYPTVGDAVDNMTNATHDDYVGAASAGLVAIIPILYWVLVVVVIIGAVMGVLKFAGE